MPYGMPYGNDMMTAMSGIASGRPRRRMRPMPSDLVDLPGSIQDPVLPITSQRRARNPGRRRQGTIPMIPPFTDPVGGGGMFLPGMGGRRRQSRFRDFPVHGLSQPSPALMPGIGGSGYGQPQLPSLAPTGGNLPGMGAMDLFGSGGFGFGG